MTLSKTKNFDVWSSNLSNVEFSDDNKRAVITIPLMHYGANSKYLFWTEDMLQKCVPLFQNKPFRYDLDGKEGSSHVTNKLSSPHFDVGWTYPGSRGAWYDPLTKTLWVRGEVTHPEVIAKLSRKTTSGAREVNYGSMGVLVEEAKCSICGSDLADTTCSNGHERGSVYEMKTCYKVPIECSKGLHVALTNDPADGEAEIKDCIFQELNDTQVSPNMIQQPADKVYTSPVQNQMEGGLAPASSQTGQPGESPSSEEILRTLAERVKTVEKLLEVQRPELVNASPQDQFTQDNMGTTTQFSSEGNMEGQYDNKQTAINPPQEAVMQDGVQPGGIDKMDAILSRLDVILQRLPDVATQDMGKEAQDANKGMIQHDETKPTEHAAPGDAVSDSTDEGNVKNKKFMNKPGMVATSDNVENVDTTNVETAEATKKVDKLQKEVADMKDSFAKLAQKLEVQNNSVPEFGNTNAQASGTKEMADMTALERREAYGEWGAYDAIFNGTPSASKFGKR